MPDPTLTAPVTVATTCGTNSTNTNTNSPAGETTERTGATTTADQLSDSMTVWEKAMKYLAHNKLIMLLIISMVMGIIMGVLLKLRPEPFEQDEISYLRFPGELLLNMLKMTIIPLIVSSLITGMCSMDARVSQKMGLRAVVYYLTTTLLAVMLGIVLVVTIKPGKRDTSRESAAREDVSALSTFLNLVRNLFPDNMVGMCVHKSVVKLMKNPDTNLTYNKVTKSEGTNMLGVVSVSLMIAACINRVGEKARALRNFFEALNEVSIVLVTAFIWYSPIGVLFLVMTEVVRHVDPLKTFTKLFYYCLTVMLGLVIHGFLTLPATYFAVVRKNPFVFLRGMLPAMLTALATASSLATLPVTMRNLEENNGVDPRVTAFVAPIGANINMDGTALYEAVAVIFIGQTHGKDLDFVKVITISLTATAAAIGAAGVPQAGLVTMVIVLTAVGFPIDGIGLILAVDWLLDRFRTSINVLGDAFGAAIVHKMSLQDLERMDQEDRERAALHLPPLPDIPWVEAHSHGGLQALPQPYQPSVLTAATATATTTTTAISADETTMSSAHPSPPGPGPPMPPQPPPPPPPPPPSLLRERSKSTGVDLVDADLTQAASVLGHTTTTTTSPAAPAQPPSGQLQTPAQGQSKNSPDPSAYSFRD